VAVAILLPSGCASIAGKTTYPVNINSKPEGAEVVVKNKYGATIQSGITPTVFMLNSSDGFMTKAHYNLVFTKEGYRETTGMLVGELDNRFFGNCVCAGIFIGMFVDAATGAMYELPEKITVTLKPDQNF